MSDDKVCQSAAGNHPRNCARNVNWNNFHKRSLANKVRVYTFNKENFYFDKFLHKNFECPLSRSFIHSFRFPCHCPQSSLVVARWSLVALRWVQFIINLQPLIQLSFHCTPMEDSLTSSSSSSSSSSSWSWSTDECGLNGKPLASIVVGLGLLRSFTVR